MKRGLMIIDRGSREREAGEELEMICEKVILKYEKNFGIDDVVVEEELSE